MADQPIVAQSADGILHQFPAGTDPTVIDAVMKSYAEKVAPAPSATPEAPSGTLKGMAKAAGQAAITEAAGTKIGVGALVKSVGQSEAQQSSIDVGLMKRLDDGEDFRTLMKEAPDDLARVALRQYQIASPEQKAAMRQSAINAVAAPPGAVERAGANILEAGHDLSAKAKEIAPLTPEEEQRPTVMGTKMLVGLGGYIAAGAMAGLPGVMGYGGIQAYGQTYDEAKAKGARDDVAAGAALLSGVTQGSMMAVPVGESMKLFQMVPVALRGKVMTAIAESAKSGAVLLGFSEASKIADNVVAQNTYDPTRPTMQGVGDPKEMAVTAAVGGLLPVLGVGAQRLAGRLSRKVSPADVKPVLEAPDVDQAIEAANRIVETQPVVVPDEAAQLREFGGKAGEQQAGLLDLFGGLNAGTVERAEDGAYHYQTEQGAVPLKVWDPNAARPAPVEGAEVPPPAISPALAKAQTDHYGKLGISVVYFENDPRIPFDGAVDPKNPNTIFLSNDPQRNAAQVGAHEVTHVLERTTLPDGTNLADIFHQQIAEGITPAGMAHARERFADTAPKREAFPEGPEGDQAHKEAETAHFIREIGADIGGEAPRFKTYLPRVIDAVQQRYGLDVAKDVVRKLIDGIQQTMRTLREFFARPDEHAEYGQPETVSQHWVTNLADIHDTLAKMEAERFGTQAEKENVALQAMRDRTLREKFIRDNFAAFDETARRAAEPVVRDERTTAEPDQPYDPAVRLTPEADRPAIDEIHGRIATLRRWLDELDQERRTKAESSPQATLLRQQEAVILGKVKGVEDRLTGAAATRLEAIRQQLDALSSPTEDSADMKVVREALAGEQRQLADATAVRATQPIGARRRLPPKPARAAEPTRSAPAEVIALKPTPAEVPGGQMLAPEARMREEVGPEVDRAVDEAGIGRDAVPAIAEMYQRADGQTPREAFDAAVSRWIAQQEEAGTRLAAAPPGPAADAGREAAGTPPARPAGPEAGGQPGGRGEVAGAAVGREEPVLSPTPSVETPVRPQEDAAAVPPTRVGPQFSPRPTEEALDPARKAIDELAEKARRKETDFERPAILGDVTPWLVEQAREAGLDIDTYRHAIDASAIRHILTRHGNPLIEKGRGQVAITAADIRRVPDVLAEPDTVIFGAVGSRDQAMIGYIKKLEDGTTLYLEERRAGRRQLAGATMRKYPAAARAETIVSSLGLYAQNVGEDGIKVVRNEGKSSALQMADIEGKPAFSPRDVDTEKSRGLSATSGFPAGPAEAAAGVQSPRGDSLSGTAAPGSGRKVFTQADLVKGEPGGGEGPKFSPRLTGANPDRTYTPEQRQAFENVGRATETTTLRDRVDNVREDLAKKALIQTVDAYAGVKENDPSGYVALRMANSAAGAKNVFYEYGPLAFDGKTYALKDRNGGVNALIRSLQGEAHDFLWWVAANRAERLKAEDRENLFTQDDIDTLKKTNRGELAFDYELSNGKTTRSREAAYADALRKMDAFNKNATDLAVESGLLKRGDVDALWSDPFYVPFYREAGEGTAFVGPRPSQQFVKQNAFKTLKGGSEKLSNDLWKNAFGNWDHLIDASIRNRAAGEVLGTAARLGAAEKLTAQEALHLSDKEQKAQTAWVMEDGKKVYYRIHDPYVMQAVAAVNATGRPGVFMDVARWFSRALRYGVTANPIFAVRNIIRDTENSIAVSDVSKNPFKNLADGFSQVDMKGRLENVARAIAGRELEPLKLPDEAVNALAGGALMRLGSVSEGGIPKTDMRNILDSDEKLATFRRYVRDVAASLKEVLGAGEDVNRLALYHQTIEKGGPHDFAAFSARDLQDFSLRGASDLVRLLTDITPFLGARMQGLYKLGRAAKDADKSIAAAVGGGVAKGIALRAGVMLGAMTLAGLALDAIYHDDEEYRARTEYDRNTYYWFKIGDARFRIPKGFELAALSSMAVDGVEAFFDKEMTGRRLVDNFWANMQQNLQLQLPAVVQPLENIRSNTRGTGGPIENEHMKALLPEDRFTSDTTLLARGVSDVVNKGLRAIGPSGVSGPSPVQLDYLTNAYGGWLATSVAGMADAVARSFSNQPTQPAQDFWAQATQGLVSTEPRASSRYVDMLYQQGKQIEQAYATYRDLITRGQGEEAQRFFEAHRDELQKHGLVSGVMRLESDLGRQIRMISNNPDSKVTAEQKKVQIMQLQALRSRAAEQAFGAAR